MTLIQNYPELAYAQEAMTHAFHLSDAQAEADSHCGCCESGYGSDAWYGRFEHEGCKLCKVEQEAHNAEQLRQELARFQHSYSAVGPNLSELFGRCDHSMCASPSLPCHEECAWHHRWDSWGWNCLKCDAPTIQIESKQQCNGCGLPTWLAAPSWCQWTELHTVKRIVELSMKGYSHAG